MYQVQVYGKNRWHNRLSTIDLNKAIALFETHKESEWSSRILKDDISTHWEYFGLRSAESHEGYLPTDLSDGSIEPLITETWLQFEQLNLIGSL
jgi:hypothetical protein